MIWWFGDMMIWWYRKMMIWRYGDIVIWWSDYMMMWWFGDKMIWWYDDVMVWWCDDKIISWWYDDKYFLMVWVEVDNKNNWTNIDWVDLDPKKCFSAAHFFRLGWQNITRAVIRTAKSRSKMLFVGPCWQQKTVQKYFFLGPCGQLKTV